MGTVEAQGSSPSQENTRAQGSEQEMKELREALGALRGGDGPAGVPENGGTENGVESSSCGNQGIGDDGIVEVVKSRVFETKVSVLRENDCRGLADSEMNGVSSLLKMRESGRSAVFSRGGAEKLDSVYASERRVAGSDGVSEGGSFGVGGEERRDGRKSEKEEKDVDCDGKIVTIDVPIVETSENMDVEGEDLSYEGYGFSVGDFVWGKIKSHPWWPGRIYDPSDASDFALKLKQKNRVLVAYFGDCTFAWCHPSQLKPFEGNFDDMVKQSSSRTFVIAVQEAVNEIGRLLDMKLSHSFAANKTRSEFTLPLAKNSGIKEGVVVPEKGIERLLAVPIEPAALLSRVKQNAEIVAIASILELEILKARLSAFYRSRGGYKLPEYEDPQPVPGLEDSLMNETVDVGNSKSAVEAPVQGPIEDEYSASPLSPKFSELCNSPRLSGNRLNHRRKQKSIAEIMGEDKDVRTKNKEGDATDEGMDTMGSTGRKKRKGREDAMPSKPVQKRKEMLLDTDRNVLSCENDGFGGKEDSNKDTSLRSKEKKEAFGNENISSGSRKETDEEVKTNEQNEKGSRERKKSKYLSPPFTTPVRGLRKGDIDTESLKISSKAQASEGMANDAGQLSPPVLTCNGESFQENLSNEVAVEWELADSSNYQKNEGDEEKTIDPKKIQAPSGEVLLEVRYAAISPQTPRENNSLVSFVDFISVFRSSLYRQGSFFKVYKKCQLGRKRKMSEPELGMVKKHQNQSDNLSPNHDFEPKKSKKDTAPGKPKVKGAPETKTGKKGADENTSAAVLFVSFWPGSSLPSKSDLITLYSKFGPLNETETAMFRTNYTARVSFLRTSDAEKALNHSQNMNPFGSSEVTFQLQYHSAGSKSGEHGERSKSKRSPAVKKDKTPASPSVSLSQGSEASKLNFIKQKLQGLTSMVEASDGKLLDTKEKLVSEMKGLLEDVNKMVESSSS